MKSNVNDFAVYILNAHDQAVASSMLRDKFLCRSHKVPTL